MLSLKRIVPIVLLTFGLNLLAGPARAGNPECVTESVMSEGKAAPCAGLLVPFGEAFDLLRFRNVECPERLRAKDDEIFELDQLLDEALEGWRIERERASRTVTIVQEETREAGHSTLEVVLWTTAGLLVGAAAGIVIWEVSR